MPILPRLVATGIGFAIRAASLGLACLACLACAECISATPPGTSRKAAVTVRQLDPKDEYPIPTPDRIALDGSFLSDDAPKQNRQAAQNELRSQDTTNEQSAETATTQDKDLTAGEGTAKEPDSTSLMFPPTASTSTKEEISFPLAEIFSLRSVEQIGKTKQVVTNRDNFITVLGASPKDGTLTKPADSVRIVSRKLGVVELTVIGETGVKIYRLKVTPSVSQLETLIARQFPLSSVEVTAAGDHMLVVEGTVETPGDVEGILTLLQNFVGTKGKIINGIKVAGVSQVQLEVVIARVDRTEAKRLGLNFEYAGKGGFGGSQVGNAGGITPINSSVVDTAIASGGNAFSSVGGPASTSAGAVASAITPASTVFVGITQELQQFMAQLEFLKKNNVVKVLARPTLVTLSGRPAEFLVGGEAPFPAQAGLGATSADFKKFGTRLNFLPVILGPGKIRLDLVPEFSTIDPDNAATIGGISVPRFITQRIHTVVEMEPGQTLVLGGLLQTEIGGQVDKIPFLGDLPYAGAAFRRVSHLERELELLVIVTPRLVQPLDGSEGPVSLPGDESRSPTDKELFFHGLPEAPHCPDPSTPGFMQGSRGSSRQTRQSPSDSGKTTVQPVVAQTQEKSSAKSKSWLRFPSVTRRTEGRPPSGPSSNPPLVVQRATTPKTAKPTNER